MDSWARSGSPSTELLESHDEYGAAPGDDRSDGDGNRRAAGSQPLEGLKEAVAVSVETDIRLRVWVPVACHCHVAKCPEVRSQRRRAWATWSAVVTHPCVRPACARSCDLEHPR